jgi:phospholipid transport system substrate-binding protein
MTPRRNRAIQAALALLLCVGGAGWAYAGEPLDVVKNAAESAIQILRDPRLKADDKKQARIDRLKEVLDPIFDFNEMAKHALGAHWRRRTPAEQEEFVMLFKDFLERIYSDRVYLYDGEKVVFRRETVENDFAEVESTLINIKGEELRVVYRLRRAEGKWKVYDALVENVSIINNYRSQFDRILSKSSFDELKKMLREKLA